MRGINLDIDDIIKFKHPIFGVLKHGYGTVVAFRDNAVIVSCNTEQGKQEFTIPYKNILKNLSAS